MRILLTFKGFHDPFAPTTIEKASHVGPILSILENVSFDAVYLFDTPGTHSNTSRTASEIERRYLGIRLDHRCLEELKDPTDHLGILAYLRKYLPEIERCNPKADFTISLSSGTPAMHACWRRTAPYPPD